MIARKTLLDYTTNYYQKNDKVICKYFKDKYGKKIDETRNCLLEEIKHNDLISEKHKKVCRDLNYFEHFLLLISTVGGCVSIFAFASLVGVSVGIASSSVGLKFFALTVGIKKYKSIIKKKRKKHNNIVLLAKTKLNSIEALIASYMKHNEFVSVNNVLREYNEWRKK